MNAGEEAKLERVRRGRIAHVKHEKGFGLARVVAKKAEGL